MFTMNKDLDYIVVGFGLAAVAFCELLERQGKRFMVIDNNKNYSSKVSGGLYNPVILKRFTLSWNAASQLELALPMYKRLEDKLQTTLDYPYPVRRKFTSIKDQNDWVMACDKPHIKPFLVPEIINNTDPNLNVPFGFGEVSNTGKIDTAKLLEHYSGYLLKQNSFIEAQFDYRALKIIEQGVCYKDLEAKYIVFAEGFEFKNNPFFNSEALKGNKGELLVIHAPDLNLDFVLKSDVFLIPLGDNYFSVGATYNWDDKDLETTTQGREKLVSALEKLIHCNYTITQQKVGIRPTVADRRPLVGRHPKHKQLAVLNGLGTRGVMIAPTVAQQLYNYLENKQVLPLEIDLNRPFYT